MLKRIKDLAANNYTKKPYGFNDKVATKKPNAKKVHK
jgi:hypothetical protein